MPTTALPEISERCRRCIVPRSATGARCFAPVAGQEALPGKLLTRSRHGLRCCDPSCSSRIGSYRHSQCCESTSEERSAGNPHATFCGNRRRATVSGDPVIVARGEVAGALFLCALCSILFSCRLEHGCDCALTGSAPLGGQGKQLF